MLTSQELITALGTGVKSGTDTEGYKPDDVRYHRIILMKTRGIVLMKTRGRS